MSSSKSTLAFYEGKPGGEKKGGAGSLARPSRSGGGGGEGVRDIQELTQDFDSE